MFKRFTTIAGKTIITRCTESARIRTEKTGRKPKSNPTSAAVAKVNKINQERILTGYINNNFGEDDLWVSLAYEGYIQVEEAVKRIEKFKRRLRDYCRKQKIPFKLIESTGVGTRSGKPHHHILVNKEITRQILWKFWDKNYMHTEQLRDDGNYQRIAKYMLQNAYQAKDSRGKYKKAWRASRSIVKPETRVENMKRQPLFDPEDLKPRAGYAIDRDSIRVYEHPITQAACIEYIEVSMTQQPRMKRYGKGKRAKEEPLYPEEWDEQMTLDEIMGAAGEETN